MINKTMPRRDDTLPHRQVSVEVVVPVYNEQDALPESIPALCTYLETYFPYRWSVVIADNASTDATLAVAEGLAAANPRVSVLHLEEKGRGRALKAAWLASEADVVAYMDVDLSTNLWSFLPLVAPLATGHSDVAIGSRLLKGAMVTRQWKRELISRCYNLLIWIEDLDSRVDVASTALEDIKRLLRVRAQRLRRQLSGRRPHDAVNTAHHARSWRLIAEATVEARKMGGRGRTARD
ncbi:MAG: glycosyltransferase [Actinobacteria bacterium]|nr:glycosyltransferase [Actinomycetota bacterium]